MPRFEYKITRHPTAEFQELVFFCTADGKCSQEQVAGGQIEKLTAMLNEHGAAGWELAHLTISGQGIMAFWKRAKVD